MRTSSRVESNFDNEIVELSRILITGIIELSNQNSSVHSRFELLRTRHVTLAGAVFQRLVVVVPPPRHLTSAS